ncbi:MAG TPA: amidophosphoribosyltransferase [Anaerolineales bacterium]|nr:amidophosphoribosyltransferase [Anaerolineales bacterium]
MNFLPDDHPQEECGLIGVFAPNEDVATMAYFGLFALQHRGQEAAGIAVSDGSTMSLHKDVGLIAQVFNPTSLEKLQGKYAIGHTRYSTTGSSSIRNAQPFMIETMYGPLAVGHNGNLVNSADLRQRLLEGGVGLSASSDSEVLTMMLARARGATWEERLKTCMKEWKGAYCLVILTRDGVYAARDPWGFRPLSVGLLPGGGYAAASETGALRTLGCQAIREIKPGEIVSLRNGALVVTQALKPMKPLARCVFEMIYFSRPDAVWDGRSVHQVRQNLGREIAREMKVAADVVIPVPDSSVPAAIGFAAESGIPYNDGFIKNRYVGRTFIEPTDSLRKRGVALKYNVVNENILDKKVILVDDSIVRGNTMGPLIKLLRDAGAAEVHLAITCPPITHPCFMGVDMGTYDDLIAHKRTVEEIRQFVGADSLHYLSLEGMMRAVGRMEGYCRACFTGKYPIEVNPVYAKTGFEKAIS